MAEQVEADSLQKAALRDLPVPCQAIWPSGYDNLSTCPRYEKQTLLDPFRTTVTEMERIRLLPADIQ